MLRALGEHGSGGLVAETKIEVKTEAYNKKSRPRGKFDNDWRYCHEKEAVLQQLFSTFGAVVVDMKAKHDLRHDRSFLLTWLDGTHFELRLDQGVGFLKSTAAHDFDISLPEQVTAIRNANGVSVEKPGSLAVPIYISGLQKA
jgi:DEAD/DEAH box helicase domain-containing protein